MELVHGYINIICSSLGCLDGYFARRAGSVTHFGKWIDPAADFIVIVSVLVYLVGVGRFPAWFYFYTLRHMVIAGFAIYCVNYGYMILHSNWWGKWATGITVLEAFFLHIFEFTALPWLKMTSIYVATFFTCRQYVSISLQVYIIYKSRKC